MKVFVPCSVTVQAALETMNAEPYFFAPAVRVRLLSVTAFAASRETTMRCVPPVERPCTSRGDAVRKIVPSEVAFQPVPLESLPANTNVPLTKMWLGVPNSPSSPIERQ